VGENEGRSFTPKEYFRDSRNVIIVSMRPDYKQHISANINANSVEIGESWN
jgi:hypothetical protein